MSITLREYQQEAIDAIFDSLHNGVRRQLVVLPTGAGKTVVFTRTLEQYKELFPALVLVHRDELVDQTINTLKPITDDISVEKAERRGTLSSQVVIASVPSLGQKDGSRRGNYPPDHFGSIIIDEAHHAAADSYRRIVDYFDAANLVLGVTATPNRGDKVRLTDVFDEVVYHKPLIDLIKQGYLAKPIGYRVRSDVSIDHVRIRGGDFDLGALDEAINIPSRNKNIVEGWKTLAAGTKTVVYCGTVAHANALKAKFRELGVEAHAVFGHTDLDQRRDLLEAHRQKRFPVLVNVGVLTEGYDDPSIETIVLARPTRSPLLYTQIVGRGLRNSPGKDSCTVIDVADATRGKRPFALPSLLGLPPNFELDGDDPLEALESYTKLLSASPTEAAKVTTVDSIAEAFEKIDLFAPPVIPDVVYDLSEFVWFEEGDDRFAIQINENTILRIVQDELGGWKVIEYNRFGPGVIYESLEDLSIAFKYADRHIQDEWGDRKSLLALNSPWRESPATTKQIAAMKRAKIPIPADLTQGQASLILSNHYAKNPTPEWLKRKMAQRRSSSF